MNRKQQIEYEDGSVADINVEDTCTSKQEGNAVCKDAIILLIIEKITLSFSVGN